MNYLPRLVARAKAAATPLAVINLLRNAGIMASTLPRGKANSPRALAADDLASALAQQKRWRPHANPAIPAAAQKSHVPPVFFSYEHIQCANEI
jgi:hypothetical protein